MSTVKANIVKIGNSRGIRIPKTVLEQMGFNGKVEMEVKGNELIIRKPRKAREGWEESFKEMHANGDDVLEDWDFPNKFDEEEWQW